MLLSDFCLDLIEHIEGGDYGVKPVVKLFADGYQSTIPDELEFIHSANIKYHRIESDSLIGTFLQLSWNRREGGSSRCRYDVAWLLERYEAGGWESVDRAIQENIDNALLIKGNVLESMDNYELAKEHLILRPLSLVSHRLDLKGSVYQTFGDIALVLYIKINDIGDTFLSAKVPIQKVAEWNLPEEELFANAMENTALLYPPRLYFYPYEIRNVPYMTGVFMGEGEGRITKIDPMVSPMLTTTRYTNGAIAAFYPGVKERIAEIFGCSYYLAFTSDGEACLHSVKKTDAKLADRMLKESNRHFSEEILTNSIYYYDADKGIMSKLDL